MHLFFSGAKTTPWRGCQVWGFECGSGWKDLLDEALAAIEEEISKMPEEAQENVYATQIKEKFGGLRLYMSAENQAMSEAIHKACVKAQETCEVCGKPGETRGGAWLKTTCDECDDVRINKRKAHDRK
jgi:hypothetical protein